MKALRERFELWLATQLAPWRTRFEALEPREQKLVGAAGVVIALAIIYGGIWQPFAKARARHESELEAAHAIANSLVLAQAEVISRGARGGGVIGSGVSLLSAVDQASKSGTLSKAPSRLQPDGENQVRVWLEDTQFDALLRWMLELQDNYGLKIEVVDIERQPTPGLVNARLSLTRPQ